MARTVCRGVGPGDWLALPHSLSGGQVSVSAKQVVSVNKLPGARWEVQPLDQPQDGRGLWAAWGVLGGLPGLSVAGRILGQDAFHAIGLPDPWSQSVPSEAGPLSRGQFPWDRKVEIGTAKIHSAPIKGLRFQLHDMCVGVLRGGTWVGMF